MMNQLRKLQARLGNMGFAPRRGTNNGCHCGQGHAAWGTFVTCGTCPLYGKAKFGEARGKYVNCEGRELLGAGA